MIRNLKTMGLTLVAVFAMSAMVAQAAHAEKMFQYGPGTTKIIGTGGEQIFDAGGSQIKCTEVKGETTEFNENAVTVTPEYPTGKCTAFGFPVHVIFTGHYTFTANKTVNLTATVHLTPTFLGSSVCTIHISAGTYKVSGYDNTTTAPMTTTITGTTGNEIPFEETAGGSCGAGSGLGAYTGNTVVEGRNASNEQTDITWTE